MMLFFFARVDLIVVSDELWKKKGKELDQKRAHIQNTYSKQELKRYNMKERNLHHFEINMGKSSGDKRGGWMETNQTGDRTYRKVTSKVKKKKIVDDLMCLLCVSFLFCHLICKSKSKHESSTHIKMQNVCVCVPLSFHFSVHRKQQCTVYVIILYNKNYHQAIFPPENIVVWRRNSNIKRK